MKILYAIGYPYRMTGSQQQLFSLIDNLPAKVKPYMVLPDNGEVYIKFRDAGIATTLIKPNESLRQYGKVVYKWSISKKAIVFSKDYTSYILKLIKFIKTEKIDLIHVNDIRATLTVGVAGRLLGVPVVTHLQGEKTGEGFFWKLFESIPNKIIANAQAVKNSLSFKAQKKTTTIYTGIKDVSIESYKPISKWLSKINSEGILMVTCFASVVPFKGYHHLMDAAKILNNRGWGEKILFICVGGFSDDYLDYKDMLIQKLSNLGLKNFFFTGWQTNPFYFYELSDLTVLPSVSKEKLKIREKEVIVRGNEGLPTTHLEAMWFGLPIVGTDIAGVREQVENGYNGFVVPPSEPESLANAIEKLISSQELRTKMGKNGRIKVGSMFSIQTYVDGVSKMYEEMV